MLDIERIPGANGRAFRLVGDLDAGVARQLQRILSGPASDGEGLTVDLSGLVSCDTECARLLVTLTKRARIAERTNPRVVRVVALDKPSDRERSQWYFQRYVEQLPAGGEIVLFDRSWYNRAGVEHVMGFCTQEEYEEFLRSCPEFERMLIRSGLVLVKYWFSVSDDEQERP